MPALPSPRGLPRERLTSLFTDLRVRRLGLMVAPAGWGKTMLLAHVARQSRLPVAWYAAEDVDRDSSRLLVQLQHAFDSAVGRTATRWTTVGDAVQGIGAMAPGPALLVLDDLHKIEGTAAEETLAQLLHAAPRSLAVLVASRATPRWNLSRRRVLGELVEVGRDDLRYRSWEVERLFREHYEVPLAPDQVTAVTRFSGGWAAALHLLHLATRGRPVGERRRALGPSGLLSGTAASPGPAHRLVREYVREIVLGELPPDLCRFLVETCPLGRLRAPLCDQLRGTSDSGAMLEELERRQLVGRAVDDGGWYRCPEVLRTHIESEYLGGVREVDARARYRSAASLLDADGALPDALRAYCQAEDWDAAARLVAREGEQLSEAPAGWAEPLPAELVRDDPWFLLSEARRHRAAGRWPQALEAYQEAERMSDAGAPAAGSRDRSGPAEVCRWERAILSSWLEPAPAPGPDWVNLLRAALADDPMAVHRREMHSGDPCRLLVAGLAALAAGAPAAAAAPLSGVLHLGATSPVVAAVAALALAAADALTGRGARGVEQAGDQLETLGILALARFTGPLSRMSDPTVGVAEVAELRRSCRQSSDPWGETMAALLEGWTALHWTSERLGQAVEPLGAAVAGFDRLGAPVLGSLAGSLRALALVRAGDPGAKEAAGEAEAGARNLGVPGAHAVATLALAECAGTDQARRDEAARLLADCSLVVPGANRRSGRSATEPDVAAPVVVRTFRGFSLTIRGEVLDLRRLKPRARTVLRILAAHCPYWVHREVLIDAVWPAADRATGTRNLQVVISSLRHALEPDSVRGGSLVARQGEAYRLALPPDAWVDHVELERALKRARVARATGDVDAVRAALSDTLDLAAGPLLPEDGPEEWVMAKRDHYRSEVGNAAQALARILVEAGEPQAAAATCERGLKVDRCSDGLWRLLVESHEAAGDVLAGARCRREYMDLLVELGVATTRSATAGPARHGQ